MKALLLAALLLASATAPARAEAPNTYVVVLKDGVSTVDAHGGEITARWMHALNGYAVNATTAQARDIANDPAVRSVEADIEVRATQAPSWGLDRIDQRYLPLDGDYAQAEGAATVTAYVIDTGIRLSHHEFGGRARWGRTTIQEGDPPAYRDEDCNGHGTHVAGTIGGVSRGVARQVRLVAVKVLGCSGSGTLVSTISGINWAVDDILANNVKPAVVNISFGGTASAHLDDAVRRGVQKGITFVLAAGNGGIDSCTVSPSRVTEAITVAATDRADHRASVSNSGACVDLFAPGDGIVSAWAAGDSATSTVSGTSTAAPHVTGAAALHLARHPEASPQQVSDALTRAATPNRIPNANAPNRLLHTGLAQRASQRLMADFDGDRTGDHAVWRPADGTWHVLKSSGGEIVQQYGSLPDDVPLPADYDGDGRADLAIWRPSTGTWYVRKSTGGEVVQQFGLANDVPVPADYDLDNRADLAVWRPSTRTFHVLKSNGTGQITQQHGSRTDDIPVVGDYNGDKRADFALWNPGTAYWSVLHTDGTRQNVAYGKVGDIPVAGDVNGDRRSDFVLWRDGTWFSLHSDGSGHTSRPGGSGDDVPLPGYFDADNKIDFTHWRPSTGTWTSWLTGELSEKVQQYGQIGDIPV